MTNRTQQVKVNGSSSEPVKVTSGVPQGSVLGPVLFLIYFNDLPDTIAAIMKLFADDATIYRCISTIEHVQEFQVSVDQSETWAEIWEFFFNLKKCKHLHVGSRYQPTTYTMKSEQEQIEIEKVSSEKVLGVIMDKALKFSEHISTKINKANRNLGIVFRTFTHMDKEMFLNLYKSTVRPHLEYAATVCTPLFKKDVIAIENVQRRATKLVSTISHLTYQERLKCVGLPSLEYRKERADLVEVFKIMNDIDDVDKEKFFTVSTYTTTRGHSLNIKSEIRSFKSNENIHKKESGSYYVVSANKASSVTL